MPVQRRSDRDLALLARIVSGTGPNRREGLFRHCRVIYDVTAVAGVTPVLVIRLEAPTEIASWCEIGNSGNITAVSNGSFLVEQMPDMWRVAWTITGTDPSFTFIVWTYMLD